MTKAIKDQDHKILQLLLSEESSNKALAYELCIGLKGNYGEEVAQKLRENWQACLHYKVELPHFHELKELSLAHEKIYKLNPSISGLTCLEKLELNGNQLDKLPNEIEQLQQLYYLDISANQFQYIPQAICNLTRLNQLGACYNKICQIPFGFDKLEYLRRLSLDDNQLSTFPEEISKLPNLEKLSIGNNHIKKIPESIKDLKKLQYLSIEGSSKWKFANLPPAIRQLDNIHALDLSWNNISDLPVWLWEVGESNGVGLISLYLGNNDIEYASDIEVVKNLPNLGILNLYENPLPESEQQIIKDWLPDCKITF